jgi:Flp pilus assembly protein TadB
MKRLRNWLILALVLLLILHIVSATITVLVWIVIMLLVIVFLYRNPRSGRSVGAGQQLAASHALVPSTRYEPT